MNEQKKKERRKKMKLRNKKTGGLANINELCVYTDAGFHDYSSLAELCDEWEDHEEPKEYCCIDDWGDICKGKSDTDCYLEDKKAIGNYFETQEEAEKAVEKLKAWKRLKDKGFKFELWDYDGGNYDEKISTGRILFRVSDDKEVDKDLDLLFGDKE